MQAVPYIDIAKEHDQHSIQDRSPLSLIIGDRGKWLAKSIHNLTPKDTGSVFLVSIFPWLFSCFFVPKGGWLQPNPSPGSTPEFSLQLPWDCIMFMSLHEFKSLSGF